MPAKFDKCVKEGGEVRTLTGPREEKPKLKSDEYIHVCIAPDGARYWGEKKKKNTKKELELETSLEELTEKLLIGLQVLTEHDQVFADKLKKALASSDIPELSKPGGQTAFQDKKKRKRKFKKVKIEISLEDVTSEKLTELSDMDIYKKHYDVHEWWNNSDYDRAELKDAHGLVIQEFENKEIIHHSWDSLDA